MALTTLPTRGALDLGPALTDARAPEANELSAVHVEALKDRVIQIATDVGIDGTPAAGSIKARIADLEDAVPQHNLAASGPPGTGDDETEGYAVGSLWQYIAEDPTAGVYYCADATEDAAWWWKIYPLDAATTSEAGLMSAADKTKIDRLYARRVIDADTAALAVTDRIVEIDSSAVSSVSLTLPDPAAMPAAVPIMIKKTSTNNAPIELIPYDDETIDGESGPAFALPGSDGTDRPAWVVWSTGSEWWIA